MSSKPFLAFIFLLSFSQSTHADPRVVVLSDTQTNKNLEEFSLSNVDQKAGSTANWSVRKTTLHGGRQEGVEMIEVDNGKLKFSVIPTRGMSIYQVTAAEVTLGWQSPVIELINPAYINLDRFGGLGWLDGFNEMMVRCGFEWAGHPGEDEGRMLTLHGLAGNIPASKVEIVIDDQPPYRIRIRGRVDEKTFKFSDFQMWTEISTVPGSLSFQISDQLTNLSDYDREIQLIYHGNFGPPLLEQDAKFVAPIKQLTPFDELAAADIPTWSTYLAPTKNYGERVYNLVPYADPTGRTKVMLHNAKADRGVAIAYHTEQLPYFALWKNTDTLKEGYVTGLEPATGFPYNRTIERKHGRVPTLAAGESRAFQLDYTILLNQQQVQTVAKEIKTIQADRITQLDEKPNN